MIHIIVKENCIKMYVLNLHMIKIHQHFSKIIKLTKALIIIMFSYIMYLQFLMSKNAIYKILGLT